MLSARRILSKTTQYSSGCIRNKTFLRYAIVAHVRALDRNYGTQVPEKLLLDEEDIKKYKIDPAIKALSKKIIYSQYLEMRSLNFGNKENALILNRLEYKAKVRRKRDLMEIPATSVALKYLLDTPKESVESEETGEEKLPSETKFTMKEDASQQSELKPIHMPYASTDSFEKIENTSSDDGSEIPQLNREYMELYEKYLKNKESTIEGNLQEMIDDKDTSSVNITRMRPTENTSKVPPNWMTDYEQYDDVREEDSSKSYYGTPNPKIPVSSIPCGGCGAPLHCQDPAIPGYLPSELFKNQNKEILRSSICQRCHFMKYYKTTLDVKVSPDEYPTLLSHIKKKKVAVILMIDLTDFPCSIYSGIMDIIGKTTQVFVVGNKVDLLPNDGPNFLKNIEQSVIKTLKDMGMDRANIKSVDLISAQTGYGVEKLINKLHKIWEYKGDVYLIGCTNVGKSSLFNALLRSDYCKIQAADLIQRATISPWPGTTLNLLKFPILSPIRRRLWMRTQRLISEREGIAELNEYRSEKFKNTKKLEYATLEGHIGNTFASNLRKEDEGYFGKIAPNTLNESGHIGFNENDKLYKDSRWFYDTPGAILPDQVLHFLTTEELMRTLPRHMISPRSFILHHCQTLFLAGLGRLDFIGGCDYITCTVFACRELPVTICQTNDADELYEKLLKTKAFAVPINDPERLKLFPPLESKSLEFTGIGTHQSTADVVLSSAGWIAMTVKAEEKIEVQAWTPQGRGIHLREPALLSRSVKLRGYKIPDSPAFARGQRVYPGR